MRGFPSIVETPLSTYSTPIGVNRNGFGRATERCFLLYGDDRQIQPREPCVFFPRLLQQNPQPLGFSLPFLGVVGGCPEAGSYRVQLSLPASPPSSDHRHRLSGQRASKRGSERASVLQYGQVGDSQSHRSRCHFSPTARTRTTVLSSKSRFCQRLCVARRP